MEALKSFLTDYWAWEFTKYHLIALVVVFVVTTGVFRRPGVALGVLVFGTYTSLAVFLMRTHESYGLPIEWALAIVLGGALTVATVAYYMIFVRG